MNLEYSIREFLKSFDLHRGQAKRALVACSGGPDSVALARALKGLELDLGWTFYLAHVNHGLRGKNSDQDEKFVRNLADALNWPVRVKRISLKNLNSGNLEESARVARYQWFEIIGRQLKASMILTGHNRDDQVETILLNLFRGSGPGGLKGMRALTKINGQEIFIGRPFLDQSKKEIIQWLRNKKIPFRSDQSNRNTRFARNWLRRRLVPDIESRFPGFSGRLTNLSRIFEAEERDWETKVLALEKRILTPHKGGFLLDRQSFFRLSVALQRRFLRRVFGQDLLSFSAVENLRSWLGQPPTSGRIKQLRKGWIAQRLSKSKGAPSTHLFWLGQTHPKARFRSKSEKIKRKLAHL